MVSEGYFHGFGEHTKIDDSTAILKVFGCSEASPDLPKRPQKHKKVGRSQKTTKNATADQESEEKRWQGGQRYENIAKTDAARDPAWCSGRRGR